VTKPPDRTHAEGVLSDGTNEVGATGLANLDAAQQRLHVIGRAAVGVTKDGTAQRFRDAMAGSGAGWYPLTALGLLVVVNQFQDYGFFVLGPEISRALSISAGGLAALAAIKALSLTLATLPISAAVQRRARRAFIAITTAFVWGVVTLATGLVRSWIALLLVLVIDGATSGSVAAVHVPLLVDSYPPSVRMRVLAWYRGADGLGSIVAPLLVGVCTAFYNFSWRGVMLVMGVVSLVAAFGSVGLRDPGFGKWDESIIRAAVHDSTNGGDVQTTSSLDDDATSLHFFEVIRRLLLIPTVRRILAAEAALGMMLIPFYTFLFFFLQDRWNMGPSQRAVFLAVMPVFSLIALGLTGPRAERLFSRDPAKVVHLGSLFLVLGVVGLAGAVAAPVLLLMGASFGIAIAFFVSLEPILNRLLMAIAPARMRPHAAALAGIFMTAVGGLGGLLLLQGTDRRYGSGGAIASLVVPGLIAAVILWTAARTVNQDIDRMIDDVIEEEELRTLRAAGSSLPTLACRHLDFSYGSVQILFDVSLSVEEGEMIALLGTNGAGKSTLLRTIAGLNLPSRGTVRLRGTDITYLDPDRRLRLGIAQVDGGRAIFDSLTVIENLRAFSFSHGKNVRVANRGIEASFAAFPMLGARRNHLASTLSGGQQQMLALSKALILRPQLLLVDELSLGLAPKVVASLMDLIRLINSNGTAVVLVEQSVSVALSLVERAYFMERGHIRFEGPSQDLLARPDLLRSVFLGGYAAMDNGHTTASTTAHRPSRPS
jgi:ABC-type branched-subunit amino acid transport system ATPase component/MFS family permease